jgi:hypothetical protein
VLWARVTESQAQRAIGKKNVRRTLRTTIIIRPQRYNAVPRSWFLPSRVNPNNSSIILVGWLTSFKPHLCVRKSPHRRTRNRCYSLDPCFFSFLNPIPNKNLSALNCQIGNNRMLTIESEARMMMRYFSMGIKFRLTTKNAIATIMV